ncbi:hypothetical protein KHA96_00800 [Bacillus sp. FJAT-49711]|nr:hypothetical protein [Bacillus sp. FJAT-49711]MBS4216847.1 hypothetical protein [Bacillus sp. FJAT-49711]
MKKKDVQYEFQYNEENNDETINQIKDVYVSGAIEQSKINNDKAQNTIEG